MFFSLCLSCSGFAMFLDSMTWCLSQVKEHKQLLFIKISSFPFFSFFWNSSYIYVRSFHQDLYFCISFVCVCSHALLWLFLNKCLIFHINVVEISCGLVWCYCFAKRNSICFWQKARSSRNARLSSFEMNKHLNQGIWFQPLLLFF